MTILELKAKLEKYPDDYKVVIDVSRDYEEYAEVTRISPCDYGFGTCTKIKQNIRKDSNVNAVLLT